MITTKQVKSLRTIISRKRELEKEIAKAQRIIISTAGALQTLLEQQVTEEAKLEKLSKELLRNETRTKKNN